jgi:hypothetical protein
VPLLAKMNATDQHDRSACWAEAMQMNVLRSVLVACARYLSLAFWPSRQARNAAAACSRSSAFLTLRRGCFGGWSRTSGVFPLISSTPCRRIRLRLLIRAQLTQPVTTHPFKNVTHEQAATSTQWPWPIKLKVDLRLVHRIFWLCQLRMSIDPIDSIFLGSKFPEIMHGHIRPHYLHAPNVALSHWR